LKIKKISENLTKNLDKEEKIKKIYNYIINNIEYTINWDMNDEKIFS
jgi:hypothetical protein